MSRISLANQWCRRCVCAHPEGQHRKSIEAAAAAPKPRPVKTPIQSVSAR